MAVHHSSGLIKDIAHRRFLPATTNFVRRMMYGNCQVPFYIYVETFVPAFIWFALTLTVLQWDDLVRARGSTLARSGPPGRPGPKHMRKVGAKNHVPPEKHRGYKLGTKHLLMLTAPLEFIGFHLLVYGAVDNFFYDWAVALDDADACLNANFYGPLIRRRDDFQTFVGPDGREIDLNVLISNSGNWLNTPFGATPPIGSYTCVLAVTITNPATSTQGFRVDLIVQSAINSGRIKGDVVQIGPGETADLMVEADIIWAFDIGIGLQWELTGPLIPAGVRVAKADMVLQRQQSLF